MKKISAIFVAVLLSWAASSVNASEISELRSKFSAARTSLVVMVFHKDQRGAQQQKLVKDSADAVSAKLETMKASYGSQGRFRELVETWNAFKETREKELVPALLKGDEEAARAIVWGIQKERFTKCLALIRDLDSNEAAPSDKGNGFAELGLRLTEARMSLLSMMSNPEKPDAEQQKLVKDTANAVSHQLVDIKVSPEKEPKYKELVETWKAFKDTRENELVPAILKGDKESAKKIAHGIQKQRLTKVMSLVAELSDRKPVQQEKEGDIEEFRAKLSLARDTLLVMLLNKDKRNSAAQTIVKNSADVVSTQLENMKPREGKEAEFKELVATWNAFRDTREKELVPAIINGNEEKARKLAYGIQNERFNKCIILAAKLDD